MDSEPDPETEKSAAEMAYQSREATERPTAKSRNHLLRGLIAGLVGAAVIGCVQWLAPSFDHQYANLISLGVGAVTAIFVLYRLQRWAGSRGHRRGVPAVVIVVIAALSTMFQFDGFSGEMLPQFKSRFGSRPPDLRSLSDSMTSPGSDGEATDVESASEDIVTHADSPGFLGPDRTGVIASRSFDVSAIESEVKTLWNQGIGAGWSSFAVSGDRAVTLEQRDEMECVTCYRLADGELLWMESHKALHQHPLGGIGPRSTPTISGNRVYAQGATGRVWCLDLQTGERIWSVDLLELAGWDQLASETLITWGRADIAIDLRWSLRRALRRTGRESRVRSESDCV